MLNILMINQPINNRGDESAHKALVRTILRSIPDAKIQVLFIERNQESVNQFVVRDQRVTYNNIPALKGKIRLFLLRLLKISFLFLRIHPTVRKIIPLYDKADIILCAPGGICMGAFQNWEHVILLSVAQLVNKPVFYYGRSIGPFPTTTFANKIFKKRSVDLLNYFSFVALRDSKSGEIADSLHVKYISTVDSAFLELPNVEIPPEISNLIDCKPYIVFVPNLLIWHYAYRNKASLDDVLLFYKKILDVIVTKYQNHNIVMLPQTFNYDNQNAGDINFFRALKRFTQRENLIIIPDKCSSELQQTIISKAECMIGARYHSVVFAINQAIPFVALSYEHKIRGLLETLCKVDSLVDITETFDSNENMKKTLDVFSYALNSVHKDIDAQCQAKKIAQDCFEKFKTKMLFRMKNAER